MPKNSVVVGKPPVSNLLSSDFKMKRGALPKSSRADLNVSLVKVQEIKDEKNEGHGSVLTVILNLSILLFDAADAEEPYMSFDARVDSTVQFDGGERTEVINRAAASAYNLATTAANVQTSLSAVGKLPLPPIDVRTVVGNYFGQHSECAEQFGGD